MGATRQTHFEVALFVRESAFDVAFDVAVACSNELTLLGESRERAHAQRVGERRGAYSDPPRPPTNFVGARADPPARGRVSSK